MQNPKLRIQLSVWKKLINALKQRGYGERETGAFLLGKKDGNIVSGFICYDDLDPHVFDTGIIIFNGDGYIPLWQHCSANSVKVLADVHTHPGDWTGQSSSDRHHPMIARVGHIALIVPTYATKRKQLLNGVGMYEFLQNKEWKTIENNSGIVQLIQDK